MQINFLRYNTPSVLITKNGRWRGDCGTIIFRNQGNTVANIDSFTLNPGESMSIDAPPIGTTNQGGQFSYVVQQNMHEYQIVFTTGVGALVIIYQVYRDIQ